MSKGTDYLMQTLRGEGIKNGMPSLCSSNPYVIKAALEYAKERRSFVLIEATANQVNQYGGYTGMKPEDFRDFVYKMADEIGLDQAYVILGGDHLGPVVFKDKPAEQAMAEAEVLIKGFVEAGFEKIHIDTSMRLGDDPKDSPLSDAVIASRGARLCATAEDAYQKAFGSQADIVYVIGSEVPIPGGTQDEEEQLHITTPEDFKKTLTAFDSAFKNEGLADAFARVIAVVVQPGVEFGDNSVIAYDREKAKMITGALKQYPNIALEGHSTDYQTQTHLKQMAEDGIRILKVGPELTFALREGLFALDDIVNGDFKAVLEETMLADPKNWEKYYHGTKEEIALKRKYSFSDRWRYYADTASMRTAVNRLIEVYDNTKPPVTLLSQYMPEQYIRVRNGELENKAEALIMDKVRCIIDKYENAMTK